MKRLRVLSIDGGAIRGIIPLHVLRTFQDPVSTFDAFIGTSVGAFILALMLYPQKKSVEAILDDFVPHCRHLFNASCFRRILTGNGLITARYSERRMQELCADIFGDARLSDIQERLVVPVFDIAGGQPYVFDSQSAKEYSMYDFYLRDVVRAATAAPTYFPAAKIQSISGMHYEMIDGAVIAYNPSLLALMMTRDDAVLDLLSLGTGATTRTLEFRWARHAGGLYWAKHYADMQTVCASYLTDMALIRILEMHSSQIPRYIRINPSLRDLGIPEKFDDVSDAYVKKMHEVGRAAAESYRWVPSLYENDD